MSVNKKMHPRNIFKTPPSFKELGQKYSFFNKYLKVELNGKLSLNFNDVDALRALSKVLLLHYFGIHIEIPKDTLVPTIPLRLNYILWLQDLVNFFQIQDDNVSLIDVGAGATCVYGLLATKLRKWKVLALESNNESFQMAKQNVETNAMTDYIEVKNNSNNENNIIIGSLNSTESYTFTMCNPPFFKENDFSDEKTTKTKSHPPKNAFTGTLNELTYPGGEVAFVEKLITESQSLKEKVMIYTTMIGHKKNLKILQERLKSTEVYSYIHTEFYQGNTARWALAWTFKNINLQEFHQHTTTAHNKKTNCPKIQNFSHSFENITCLKELMFQLEKVLKEMKTIYKIPYVNENLVEIKVQAVENTWKNARRKRREQARKENILKKNIESTMEMINNYLEIDYIEQIQNIINIFESNVDNTPELNDNMTKLKHLLCNINGIQLNITRNLSDIHMHLSQIEIQDQLFINQFLHCESVFKEKQIKMKRSLDAIFKSICPVIDNNHSDITEYFLQLLSHTSGKRTIEEIEDVNTTEISNKKIKSGKRTIEDIADNEIFNKKIKMDECNAGNIVQDNTTTSNGNIIIEFMILLNKISDPDGIKITLYTIKNNDHANVLCEIYNYILNKLKK